MEVELIDLDGTLKWNLGRTVVVLGERCTAEIGNQDRRHSTGEQIVC